MRYEIIGKFKMGRNKNQKFHKEIDAQNREYAKEKLYSIIGSKHRVKRRNIDINRIKEL